MGSTGSAQDDDAPEAGFLRRASTGRTPDNLGSALAATGAATVLALVVAAVLGTPNPRPDGRFVTPS